VQFMGLSRNGTEVFIITEYISGGDLRKLLKDETRELSWLLRARLATDCAYAMTFLHSKGLIHRDLKSNNLLVTENWKVKVCDFGFSRRVNKGELMTLCGTDEWMAPEVMCGDRYDEKADVFSFGMVMTELVTRKKPPLRKPATGFRFEVGPFQASAPPDCPKQFIELAIHCSEQTPENRPHFKDVLPRLKAMVAEVEAKEKENELARQKEKELEDAKKKDLSKSGGGADKDKKKGDKKHKHHHKVTEKEETPEEKKKRRDERRKRRAEKAAKLGKTLEEYDRERKKDKKK